MSDDLVLELPAEFDSAIEPLVKFFSARIESDQGFETVQVGSKVTYRLVLEPADAKKVATVSDQLNYSGGDWEFSPNDATKAQNRDDFARTGITSQIIAAKSEMGVDTPPPVWPTWYVIYDKNGSNPKKGHERIKPRKDNDREIVMDWGNNVGKHVVVCQLNYESSDPARDPLAKLSETQVLLAVGVDHDYAILSKGIRKARGEAPPNPHDDLRLHRRYLKLIKSAEAQQGPPSAKAAAYERTIREREEYIETLEKLVSLGPNFTTWETPLRAYYAPADSKTSAHLPLRLYLRVDYDWVREDGSTPMWRMTLVDWTNPTDARLHGTYRANAETPYQALFEGPNCLLRTWMKQSEYHPGHIQVDFPDVVKGMRAVIRQRNVKDNIDKNVRGTSMTARLQKHENPWDNVSDFLSKLGFWLSLGTGLLGLTVRLVGAAATALKTYKALFGGMALVVDVSGAAIAKKRRDELGESDWKSDVLDYITIAGPIFDVVKRGAGLRWVRGATLLSKAADGVEKLVAYGEWTAQRIETLLIAERDFQTFRDLVFNAALDPRERVDKLLNFMKDKGVRYLNRAAEPRGEKPAPMIADEMLARLSKPGEVIDLDREVKQRGHTDDGFKKSYSTDDPKAHDRKSPADDNKAKKRGKTQFDNALPPHRRGMRAVDDFDFMNTAHDLGVVIIVRDLNTAALDHVNSPFTAPKPVDLKAKTLPAKPPPKLKNATNAGLAAVHPDDPRLHELLRDMKPPMKDREEYVRYLEKKGYKVLGPESDYLVVSPTAPGGYFPDYDLHGVYDATTGQDAYSESFRNDVNARLRQGTETRGKDLVLHGPHDRWPEREMKEAGPNRGPKPPVTVYAPYKGKVKKFRLKTVKQMKAFYEAWGIPWDNIYPELEANGGKYPD